MSGDISFYQKPGKGTLSVREAGRRGGLAVLRKYGKGYFAEIGKMGQEAMRTRYPNKASAWGKQGGRPKKLEIEKNMGEWGK